MCNRQFKFYAVSLHDLKERFRYNAYSSCDFTLVLAGTQKQQQIKGEKTKKLTLTILLCCKTINRHRQSYRVPIAALIRSRIRLY